MVAPMPFEEFHEFVRRHEPRLVRTAAQRLLPQLGPQDPQAVTWLVEAASVLGDRLVAADPNVGRGTAYTYSSRLRGAAKRYLAWLEAQTGAHVHVDLPVAESPGVRFKRGSRHHLTPREQLEDAYEALVRWPDLRRFLAVALVEAENALLPEGEEAER